MKRRQLGRSDIQVSTVAMGCWPIAGITTLNATKAESLRTLEAAIDCGINFFDTAYAYGIDGESESMIGEVIRDRRDDVVIATKGGIHRVGRGQDYDARPETIRRECDESLARLGTDRVELYYLHAPDPNTPIAETAAAIADLIQQGKVLTAGASNLNVAQLKEFHDVCPLTAVQPHFNMLQQEIELDIAPWCGENQVSLCIYWPLMKGLLAGKLPRDHKFDPKDGRAKYPMFQGEEWQKNQDFLDDLRLIAEDVDCTVAQLVVAWTISRPGITSALCGAKRDWQIRETAEAMSLELNTTTKQRIDDALQRRGPAVSRAAV
ncbi:aldo/keto reductase [Fuerstiella marisgermanici]|uniref:General stress protein 69 n=1 Tax=Fuerstiella marisgermanici TaxID=1891926 RepID=A0A1P8WL56_9PLAN|nr:aldo/keto reductase [Fuerstiella marisgermanici]APZ94794.1 General stress protein 69 [Fuerstiella marisgermanici]